MSLVDLWTNAPDQVRDKHLQQIIAWAGDLRDGSRASAEFREFVHGIPSGLLSQYAADCLDTSFKDSGLALQDVVNEIGARLGYSVTAGRYRGSSAGIPFDGLWGAPDGHHLVVEVKTTDAYRIDLGKIARYRRDLVREGHCDEEESSILMVVGREDTGDVEAQIRGSKHAWDMRLISVEALLRLLRLRENVEDPVIERRIRAILVPREYTRVDEIIELVFSTTEEIFQEDEISLVEGDAEDGDTERQFTPVRFNEACAKRVADHLGVRLLKRSRATFESPDAETVVLCVVSKEHTAGDHAAYWYGFYLHQKERLEQARHAYIAFGCGSPNTIVLMPVEEFVPLLSEMHQTHREDGTYYWHVQIHENANRLVLHRRKGSHWPDVTGHLLSSGSGS